jgi:apolipoprotein N-acyltransferase
MAREQVNRPWWRQGVYGWAVGFGALHAWSLSPWCAALHGLAPAVLQTVALMGVLWALSAQDVPHRRVAAGMWLYGSAWLVGATGWMYVSLHRYGGLPAWLTIVAVVGLCMALSLYMGAVGWVWGRWRSRVWWRDGLLFAGLWLLAEMARAVIFTGFPWGASGYGMLASPLVKLAPLLGVYGLGAVWACAVALAVFAWRSNVSVRVRVLVPGALAVSLLACAIWTPPTYTRPHGQPLSVTLLQGNVPQDEKFIADYQVPMLIWHARQLLAAQGKLVIAPETAIPLLPSQLPEGYWDRIKSGFTAQTGRYALVGVPLGDFDVGYTNSVVGLSGEAASLPEGMYRYNKHHLVPFGEVIPFGFHWFVEMMNMPLGDFTRGPVAAPAFKVVDQRIGPNICYEDLYGEEIAARFRDEGTAPTILANVSNLAWFGEQVAIYQHLQIARMRSLEFQLPTLRATNTGATVVIDHAGQVTAALKPNTQGVLQAVVQGRSGVTPFAWWASRWGLWPLFALALLMLALGLSGARQVPGARSGEGGRAIH